MPVAAPARRGPSAAGCLLRPLIGPCSTLAATVRASVIGELLPSERHTPVTQLETVPGMQRLPIDGSPVDCGRTVGVEVYIDVLILGIPTDFAMLVMQTLQAQVRVRAATDRRHSGQQLEHTLIVQCGIDVTTSED